MKKIWITLVLSACILIGFSYAGKNLLAEKEPVEAVRIENEGSIQEPINQGKEVDDEGESLEDLDHHNRDDYPVFVMGKDIYSYEVFDNGDFWSIRIPSDDHVKVIERRFPIEGNILKVYIMEDNEWKIYDTYPGNLNLNNYVFIVTDEKEYMFSRPDSYTDIGFGTRKSQDSIRMAGALEVQDGKWSLTYYFQSEPYVHHVIWGISSDEELIDFEDQSAEERFGAYDFINQARFLEDGYYYKSPESYLPSDIQSYWRSPSMYLVTHFVERGNSLAEELLAKGWLKVAGHNINEEGYFTSLPRSNWLYKDYGIEDGFFDTRFNGDMITTYLEAYQKFGIESFRESYLTLAEYYLHHASDHHFSFGQSGQGWLVYDYYHEDSGKLPVHTSLNHQVHAISMFLKLFLEEGNYDYFDTAMHMLRGIKATRDLWINEEGDLHYAMLSDGTMGLSDYPLLTMNDMVALQEVLEEDFYGRDPDLDLLIDVKKKYYGYE